MTRLFRAPLSKDPDFSVPAGASPYSDRDGVIALLLFLTALAGYARLAIRLAQGRYAEYLNLAFDFDPYLVLSLLTATPGETLGFKHPLLLLLRPFGLGLTALGVSPKVAAGMMMATFGAATVSLLWCFLRLAGIRRPESLLLSLLFGLGSTQILNSLIPESYGVSGFAIVLLWCIALVRVKFPPLRFTFLRYCSALILMGATVTNVVQAFIAELAVATTQGGISESIYKVLRFGSILAAWFSVLCMIVWHEAIWKAVQNPLETARQIWWLQTQGPRTDAIAVFKTFLAFSFVAPNYTFITLPESTHMRDFRDWSFTATGAATVAIWLIFAGWGAVCALCNRRYRPIAIGIVLALVFNLLFHCRFQFRGSIYLYAGHVYFLVFALAAGSALVVRGNGVMRLAYLALVTLLVALFGLNNVPMAEEFVTAFDRPDTLCPAPCR